MIRKLTLSVVALFGMTLLSLAQGLPGGGQWVPGPAAEVKLSINGAPTQADWKMSFKGTFSTALNWSVSDPQLVLIPKTGGVSRLYNATNPAAGEWSATTTDQIPEGDYWAFLIAKGWNTTPTATVNPEGGPPPAPTDPPKYDYCSPILAVTSGEPFALPPKPVADTPYFNFAYIANGTPTRAGNPASFVATADLTAGTYVPAAGESRFVRVDSSYLVTLPKDGGRFTRSPGTFLQQAQQPRPPLPWRFSANSPNLPNDPTIKYHVYMHISTYRTTNQVPDTNDQIVTTALATDK